MYFDPNPKERLSDLFNYKKELDEILSSVEHEKAIFIKGLRRTGKTSLMKVAINEIKYPSTYIDTRIYSNRTEFLQGLVKSLNTLTQQVGIYGKIKSHLPKEVELSGVRVKLTNEDLYDYAKELDHYLHSSKKRAVLFVDEAQRTKRFDGDAVFASLYDATKNLCFVFSGSEIGLFEDFSGASSESPFYGRAKRIIEINPLLNEKSLEFLRQGFIQAKKTYKEEELEEAVERLDGIIGWLTLYGHYRVNFSHKKSLEQVLSDAVKITSAEFKEFLKNKQEAKSRYEIIMYGLSERNMQWTEIKRFLEIETGTNISDGRLYEYLKNLMNYSFIEEKEGQYFIPDPVMKEAFKQELGRK
jgi:AAA+ ATPase superfamily predicted ATPase